MKKLLSIMLLLPLLSFASSFTGAGYGKTELEAKKEAFSDLSNSLISEVKSHFVSIQQSGIKQTEAIQSIETTSELPLIAVDTEISKAKDGFMATATLSSEKSLSAYTQRANDCTKEINSGWKKYIANSKTADKESALLATLKNYDEYEKITMILGILGSSSQSSPSITKIDIVTALQSVSGTIDSLDSAAKKLSNNISLKDVFVYPPKTEHSSLPTQFASIIKDKLSAKLNALSSPKEAKIVATGNYIATKDGIELTYYFNDTMNGKTLEARNVKLLPSAYAGIDYAPQEASIETLLKEGVIGSSDFKIMVNSSKGSSNLLFKAKEEVEILVKLNKMGYFYIVGHTKKAKETYSYLLELNDKAENNNRFLYRLAPEEINKWISIGKFEVTAPFGVESMQVIASSKEPTNLPEHKFDKDSGLYVLGSSDIKTNITKTRALRPKTSSETKASEAVLEFVTVER